MVSGTLREEPLRRFSDKPLNKNISICWSLTGLISTVVNICYQCDWIYADIHVSPVNIDGGAHIYIYYNCIYIHTYTYTHYIHIHTNHFYIFTDLGCGILGHIGIPFGIWVISDSEEATDDAVEAIGCWEKSDTGFEMHQHATIPIKKMGGFSISMSTSEKREISSQKCCCHNRSSVVDWKSLWSLGSHHGSLQGPPWWVCNGETKRSKTCRKPWRSRARPSFRRRCTAMPYHVVWNTRIHE